MKARITLAACVVALAVALVHTGCGNAPTDPDCCVQWVALVESSVPSGAEIRLDGQSIYRNASANLLVNRTELVRSADTNEHVFEFTVLAAETEPAVFGGRVTIQRRPGGEFEFLRSEPTELRVGGRIVVRVPQ